MLDRIAFDPQIMRGRACIRGMHIPVSVIVRQIGHGASFEEIRGATLTLSVRISSKPSRTPPG